MFLLLSCGDVSLNPGPINYKYPCGVCAKAVRKNQNGIYCDGCNLWHHIKCLDMPIDTFRELGNSENLDWYCQKCTIPQFSDSFFENSRNSSFGNLDSVSDSGSLPDTEKAYIRELQELKCKHKKNAVISFININSFRYKYTVLQEILYERHVDILIVAETKLDSSFPDAQFKVDGYNLYRKDRNSHGGGVIIYINSNITSRQRPDLEFNEIESISVELCTDKTKWLLLGAYKPPSLKPETFSTDFQQNMDKVYQSFENVILLGDLNLDLMDHNKGRPLRDVCDLFDLNNLVKNPTCFMKDSSPSLVDVILTNRPILDITVAHNPLRAT